MRKLGFVICLLSFAACSSGPVPRDIIQPEKMQKVVSELIQVDEFITNFVTKDSTVDLKKKRSLLYEQTFKLNGTTRKDFYTSYRYYEQHPDIQKALYDTIYNRANRVNQANNHPKP